MEATTVPGTVQDLLASANRDPEVPKVYCNGFVNAVGPGDITTMLLRNDRPVAVLNMSFTVAKTLAEMLGRAIADLEQDANIRVPSVHEVAAGAAKQEETS